MSSRLSKCILCILNILFLSCTPDSQVTQVLSGNMIEIGSGDVIRLTNVSNSRYNYEYLCAHVLWQDVIVVNGAYDEGTLCGIVYNSSGECINDLLEKEMPVSSPTPPTEIVPTDSEIPTRVASDDNISEQEWRKPNIKSTKDVSQVYSYVINVFKEYEIDYMPHIPVLIISREQMYVESGNNRTVGLAYTQTFNDGEQAFEIHIISGLTKLDFAEVLAHEIMHTWINQNQISITSEADLEGLCNYASYIVLKSVNTTYAQNLISAMMRNPDPIYGEGFRNVKSEIDEIGFNEYLSRLGGNKIVYNNTMTSQLEIPFSYSTPIYHTGFSVSYNEDTRLPNWVAYELTYEEVQGSVPRAKMFTQDPDVRGVQADNEDYRNTGWDKGHMCPAGDMKWSEQAMNESFYFTNICPQNPNLNGGDWKDLEEKCRAITQFYGKVYIVCGAIVGDAINGTLGYNRVTIPDAFYKVLLVETSKGYEGIGFYFENKAGHKSLGNYARSIDYIEQITNIDFFPALPDNIETDVESKYNLSVWHIR